jgi:hypothetical protein
MGAHTTSVTVLDRSAAAQKRAGDNNTKPEAGAKGGGDATRNAQRGSSRDSLLDQIIRFFASLRLTVVLLGLGLVLVFAGTLAQVDLGLLKAQNEFFRSFVVYWTPKGSWASFLPARMPVLPGGYAVGGLLLINLITAHFTRFKWTRKKMGIWLTHVGLILLLLGQLLTDILSRESHMWLNQGQAKNYSDSSSHSELAVVDTTSPDYDDVVVFPQKLLTQQQELGHEKLPFKVHVKDYFINSEPQVRAPMVDKALPQATRGVASRIEFAQRSPAIKMDEANIAATVVEVLTDEGSLGTWVLSNWLTEEKPFQAIQLGLRKQLGEKMAADLCNTLAEPQEFTFRGHTYQLALRPVRFYQPFSIQLQRFSHDRYRGTDIPKNFSSRVRVTRPATGEDREVLIYMNSPLRYDGETFYQAGFDDVDPGVTILQVVHNPSWLTPYLSCILVALGLVVQFGTHLAGFIAKRRTA